MKNHTAASNYYKTKIRTIKKRTYSDVWCTYSDSRQWKNPSGLLHLCIDISGHHRGHSTCKWSLM